jgi:hypothetical protein
MFITGVNDTCHKLFSSVKDTGEKFVDGVNMKFLYFFLLLWLVFALLDPDPDFKYGSGPTDLIDSGSETLVSTVPVPVPVLQHLLFIKMCRVILGAADVDAPVSRYGRATKRCATCLSNAPSYKEGSCLKKVMRRERLYLFGGTLSAFLMYHTKNHL